MDEEDEDPFEIARVDCNGCSQHNRPLEAVPQMINLSQGSLHRIHRITISGSHHLLRHHKDAGHIMVPFHFKKDSGPIFRGFLGSSILNNPAW